MSRIGKIPVLVPAGVEVTIKGATIQVKGAKGTLTREVPSQIKAELVENKVVFTPAIESDTTSALWGLYRMLVENMVIGVSVGYKKELEIVGVGYKAEMKGKDLLVYAGYSSPTLFAARDGIVFSVENQTKVSIAGIEKETVGQSAAEIRKLRKPEPYKGKGIKYLGEKIRRKAGKVAGK